MFKMLFKIFNLSSPMPGSVGEAINPDEVEGKR